MADFNLEDYVRIAQDVYFPAVDPFYPEKILEKPDHNGFYKNSFLQAGHGWKREEDSKPLPNGFFAAAYKHPLHKECVVIAYRGSDDFYDFAYHDLTFALGVKPAVEKDAIQFFHSIIKQQKYQQIMLVGHSLGGALAQIVTEYAIDRVPNMRSKVRALCFNAPQLGYISKFNPRNHFTKGTEELEQTVKKCRDELASNNNVLHTQHLAGALQNQDYPFYVRLVGLVMGAQPRLASKIISDKSAQSAAIAELFPQAVKTLDNVVNNLKSYKDLYRTINAGDIGYNALYDLLAKPHVPKSPYHSLPNYHSHVFNINSLFDMVHTVGMPFGKSLTLDIGNNSLSRMRSELRAMLTIHPKYQEEKIDWNAKQETLLHYQRATILRQQSCKFDLKKLLNKLDINSSALINLILRSVVTAPDAKIQELKFLLAEEHSIQNLGAHILEHPILAKLRIPHSLPSLATVFGNLQHDLPLPTYTRLT